METNSPGTFQPHGICKLTRQEGRFVDSHIIPESLTRASIRSNPLFQYRAGTPGARPVRRWSSWYDPTLVTEEGEKLLSELDNWAVSELRRHRLVWSGWGNESSVARGHTLINGGPIGVRHVEGIEPTKLRLFFLSLLWRAAATTLEEFSEVVLVPEELERLRSMIVNGDAAPLSFYPCQLTQLSTKGVIHNYAPLREMKYAPDLRADAKTLSIELPTFRFYFDGLIVHMHIALPEAYSIERLGNLIVGADESLVLSTVSFEESAQYMNMRTVRKEHGLL
jgi:hypothetical protein